MVKSLKLECVLLHINERPLHSKQTSSHNADEAYHGQEMLVVFLNLSCGVWFQWQHSCAGVQCIHTQNE